MSSVLSYGLVYPISIVADGLQPTQVTDFYLNGTHLSICILRAEHPQLDFIQLPFKTLSMSFYQVQSPVSVRTSRVVKSYFFEVAGKMICRCTIALEDTPVLTRGYRCPRQHGVKSQYC